MSAHPRARIKVITQIVFFANFVMNRCQNAHLKFLLNQSLPTFVIERGRNCFVTYNVVRATRNLVHSPNFAQMRATATKLWPTNRI